MKITLFNGSPKGARGNTHVMAEAFLEGAAAGGAEVDYVPLSRLEIKHRQGCLKCWFRDPPTCTLKDDMEPLIGKFMTSDLVVIATPLYVDNVSGMTKVFMDRLMLIADPHFEIDEEGESRHVKGTATYPKVMAMASCGFPERSQFQVLELFFRRVCRNLQLDLVGEIYRSQGILLTLKHELLAPVVAQYRELLVRAGREMAQSGRLSEEMAAELDQELVPREMYNDGANRYWDKRLKERSRTPSADN